MWRRTDHRSGKMVCALRSTEVSQYVEETVLYQTLTEPRSHFQLHFTATRDDAESKAQSQRYRRMPGQGRARIASGSAVWALSR
jgi:hypothetical protein